MHYDTVYIKNLDYRYQIKEVKRRLYNFLTRFTKDCKVKMTRGMSGQAFVKFYSSEDCQLVVSNLNRTHFMGRLLEIERAKTNMGEQRLRKATLSRSLLLKNVTDLSVEDIAAVFISCAGFAGVRIVKVKNVAFVDFINAENANAALLTAGNCLIIKGRNIEVAQSK